MSEIAVDNGLLLQVDRNVKVCLNNINIVSGQVVVLEKNLAEAQDRLKKLRAFVEAMRREQRNAAALQRALTEIIRVRQELEQKFGKYQEVRDSMLGILQANDAKLVTTSAISRISEDLMISTPNYWLAPCVVALAAWISNNEELAKRAVQTAIERDPEKTALLMALITRRAAVGAQKEKGNDKAAGVALEKKRMDVSKNWLSFYFEAQDPNNISRSVLVFVNAYANGIFGEADKTCDDFIENKWLKQLEEKSKAAGKDFAAEQKGAWFGIFNATLDREGHTTAKKYPTMAQYADKQVFENIAAYADRIDFSEGFLKGYFVNINNTPVDPDKLVAQIDEYLVSLVTDVDKVEVALRDEEEMLQIIKEKEGDMDVANEFIARKKAEKAKLMEPVSLIEYLNETVSGREVGGVAHDASEKKTALKFTRKYIQESYDEFMFEKKEAFPKKLKVKVENIDGELETENDAKLYDSKVKKYLENERDTKKEQIKPTKKIVLAAIIAVLGIILGIAASPVFFAAVVVGAIILITGINGAKKAKLALDEQYDKRIKAASATIKALITEWLKLQAAVAEFESKPKFDVTQKKI